jgi:bacterioferritin-associated ferredoxin
MYVCICNALNEKDLAQATAGENTRTVADVFRQCGRRPRCGKCLHEVAEMIESHRTMNPSGVDFSAAE